MKSWKARLLMVFAMLAMVLAVSIPAMALDEEDFFDEIEDSVEDSFDDGAIDVESVDCFFDDEDDDDDFVLDLEDFDDDNDGIDDLNDLFNDVTCVAVFEIDSDFDGIIDDDDDNDGIFDFDDDDDDDDDDE